MKKMIILILCLLLIGCNDSSNNDAIVNQLDKEEEIYLEEKSDFSSEAKISTEELSDEISKVKVNVDKLKVRESYTIDSGKRGSVYINSVYEILETKINGDEEVWYKISVGEDNQGWIASWFTEDTEDEMYDYNKDFQDVDIELLEEYVVGKNGDVLSLRKLVSWDGKVKISVNNKSDDKIKIDRAGIYMIQFVFEDELGRMSDVIHREVSVYNPSWDNLRKLHVNMDKKSDVIDIIDIVEVDYDKDVIGYLYIEDGVMHAWYEVEHDGKTGFFYEEDVRVGFSNVHIRKYIFILENGNRIEYSKEKESFEALPTLEEYGLMHIKGKNNIFVSNQTGKLYEFNEYEISPDGSLLLAYDSFYHYPRTEFKNQERTIYLFSISDGRLKKLYYETILNKGISDIEWYEDNSLTYIENHERENLWNSISPLPVEKKIKLSTAGSNVQKKVISDETLDELSFENINLYSSMTLNSSVIGIVTLEDITSIDYTRTLEITDDGFIIWYSLQLKNGTKWFYFKTNK